MTTICELHPFAIFDCTCLLSLSVSCTGLGSNCSIARLPSIHGTLIRESSLSFPNSLDMFLLSIVPPVSQSSSIRSPFSLLVFRLLTLMPVVPFVFTSQRPQSWISGLITTNFSSAIHHIKPQFPCRHLLFCLFLLKHPLDLHRSTHYVWGEKRGGKGRDDEGKLTTAFSHSHLHALRALIFF